MDTQGRTWRVIGLRTPKVDALDKVTGRAQFGADVILPRLLVGKVLRSPYAHARIKRIDTSTAAALPGVQAVITGNDLPRVLPGAAGGTGAVSAREHYLSHEILARDKVLFHGQVVAAVAATSSDIAEEAVECIEVEYEALPHVTDPVAAMRPEAVLLHPDLYTQSATGKATTPSNVAEHLTMGRGDIGRGFAEADVVVERTFRTQVEGQMQGGATQGIGWALSEVCDFDAQGVLQNAHLLDYRLPTSLDVPHIGTNVVEAPSGDHPYGIRAVGQVPIVPPAAALANAIYRAVGVRLQELPMTPERLHWALQQADIMAPPEPRQ